MYYNPVSGSLKENELLQQLLQELPEGLTEKVQHVKDLVPSS